MKNVIGLLVGAIRALIFCVGGPFVAYRVHVNQMKKEYEQYVSEVGAGFEKR